MLSLKNIKLPRALKEFRPSTGLQISVLIHLVLLTVIIVGIQPEEKKLDIAKPRYIEAKLLQMKPAVVAPTPPKAEPKPKVDKAAIKRAEDKKRKAKQKKEQDKAAKKRKDKAKKKAKELAEKKRKNQRDQKLAEQKRKQQIKEQRKRELDLAQALALDNDEPIPTIDDSHIGTYMDYMAGLIASNWSRPPSARRGMEVLLEISMGSAGRVNQVKVARSSGNSSFDLSAELAVKKVGQFPRLKEMEPALYQRDFRRIYLLFRPDDLRK